MENSGRQQVPVKFLLNSETKNNNDFKTFFFFRKLTCKTWSLILVNERKSHTAMFFDVLKGIKWLCSVAVLVERTFP